MPYITQARREDLRAKGGPQTPGELNFCITDLYLRNQEMYEDLAPQVIEQYVTLKGVSYHTINDVMGVGLSACFEYLRRTDKRAGDEFMRPFVEFYAVTAIPYEDKKIAENGDVYPQPS